MQLYILSVSNFPGKMWASVFSWAGIKLAFFFNFYYQYSKAWEFKLLPLNILLLSTWTLAMSVKRLGLSFLRSKSTEETKSLTLLPLERIENQNVLVHTSFKSAEPNLTMQQWISWEMGWKQMLCIRNHIADIIGPWHKWDSGLTRSPAIHGNCFGILK